MNFRTEIQAFAEDVARLVVARVAADVRAAILPDARPSVRVRRPTKRRRRGRRVAGASTGTTGAAETTPAAGAATVAPPPASRRAPPPAAAADEYDPELEWG